MRADNIATDAFRENRADLASETVIFRSRAGQQVACKFERGLRGEWVSAIFVRPEDAPPSLPWEGPLSPRVSRDLESLRAETIEEAKTLLAARITREPPEDLRRPTLH